MYIRSSRDLRLAYEHMRFITDFVKRFGMTGDKVQEMLKDIKRQIRDYNKRESDRRLVCSYGIDGYIELIELPDVEDPVEYFEECEYLHYIPSQYDCTGQRFTEWYKIFKRNGKTMAYHCVGVDV